MIKLIKNILSSSNNFLSLSMGTDSVAAFHFLLAKGYKFTPVHFNHNLRNQNHIMEAKFFKLCEKFNLKGKAGRREFNQEICVTEKDCREARLNFYSSLEGNIITAHHLNDWVESYLLNCLRGKPNHTPFELISNFPKFKIFHPFLLSRKEDFVQYVSRNGLKEFVVEDETNFIVKGSRRNWIRNKLIPDMKEQKLSLEKYAIRKIKEELDKQMVNKLEKKNLTKG